MKAKMMIVAVIAMGAQYASAAAPTSTGCQNNASKQTISNNSQEQSTRVIDGLVKVASADDHSTAPADGKK